MIRIWRVHKVTGEMVRTGYRAHTAEKLQWAFNKLRSQEPSWFEWPPLLIRDPDGPRQDSLFDGEEE